MSEDGEDFKFSDDVRGYTAGLERIADTKHPYIDILEPEIEDTTSYNAGYRAASKRALYLLDNIFAFILTAENKETAAYAVAFSLGNMAAGGKTQNEIADKHSITRAAMSKNVKAFQRSCDLGPSTYMKSDNAVRNNRKARIVSINEANNKQQETITICQTTKPKQKR